MYGKTTRSRIGSSGRTSGITGSPFRLPSFVVTPRYSITGAKKPTPATVTFSGPTFALRSALGLDLLRLDECDRSRRHRPDSAESVDRDVAHLAGQRRPAPAAGSAPPSRPRRAAAPAAPCWSRPRRGPCRRGEAPRRPARSFPSGRQFCPSKRASPAGRRGPDRAVAAARDRVHRLAGQPVVLVPGPQLPFLPAADPGQRRVVGRAAVEQDAGQAGRQAATPPAATFSLGTPRPVLDGVSVAELDLDGAVAAVDAVGAGRRAARATACSRPRRPRTTPSASSWAGSSSAILCSGCQSVSTGARRPGGSLVITRPHDSALARDRVGRPLCVGGQRQRRRRFGLAEARRLVAVAVGQPGARTVGDDEAAHARRARDVEPPRVADQLRPRQVARPFGRAARDAHALATRRYRSLPADAAIVTSGGSWSGVGTPAQRPVRSRTSDANCRLPGGYASPGASGRSVYGLWLARRAGDQHRVAAAIDQRDHDRPGRGVKPFDARLRQRVEPRLARRRSRRRGACPAAVFATPSTASRKIASPPGTGAAWSPSA